MLPLSQIILRHRRPHTSTREVFQNELTEYSVSQNVRLYAEIRGQVFFVVYLAVHLMKIAYHLSLNQIIIETTSSLSFVAVNVCDFGGGSDTL